MAKTDPSKEKKARLQRTNSYAEKVRQIFAASVNQILELKKKIPDLANGVMYSFDGDSEKVQAEVEAIFRRMHSLAMAAIKQGISLEWSQANQECDALVKSCFGKKVMETPMFKAYTQRNTDAMQAFINRSERGMNLSDRVWKSVRQQRDELEVALTVSMGEGASAQQISRRVRQYLNDPDLMFRRFRYKVKETEVKDDEGNVIGKEIVWGKKWKKAYRDDEGRLRFQDYDKDSYKVGSGVYKSAARNAMRLARTETNMAYRNADHERWQQMDFVLGQRVQLSEKHPVYDICDELAGDYPKDFKFEGWHPQCFCFVTPILVDEDEMAKMTEAALNGEEYKPQGEAVYDYPAAYKDWVRDNADTIEQRWSEGKANPYFIEHNQDVYKKIVSGYDFKKDKAQVVQNTSLNTIEEEERKKQEQAAKEIEEKASQWASVISYDPDRQLAIDAAKKVLELGFDLPPIEYVSIPNQNRMMIAASYDSTFGKLSVNKSKAVIKRGGVSQMGKDMVASGWNTQDNPILHELGHYLSYQFGLGANGDMRINFGKDRIQKYVSKYAATTQSEFYAELISGILAGKEYPLSVMNSASLLRSENPTIKALWIKGLDKDAYKEVFGEEKPNIFLKGKAQKMAISGVRVTNIQPLSEKDLNYVGNTIREIGRGIGIFDRGKLNIEFVNDVTDGTLMSWRDGSLSVTNVVYELNNGNLFCPSANLLSAFKKLKQGTPLTFDEEYSIESLFHESIHARSTKKHKIEAGTIDEVMQEVCTQLYARVKYTKVLKFFGAEPLHYDAIQTQGYGYKAQCAKLRGFFENGGELQISELINIANETESGERILRLKLKKMGMTENEIDGYILNLYLKLRNHD